MCGSMADIQSAAAEIRPGKKRKKEERTNHSMKIYMVSLFDRATIITIMIITYAFLSCREVVTLEIVHVILSLFSDRS